MLTISEQLLERFCDVKGIRWERIPESTRRLADYKIWLGATLVIVEVKQLDLNKEDKALIRAAQSGDEIPTGFRTTGNIRVRNAIDNAYLQLKNAAKVHYPAILIIHDNTLGLSHLGYDDILNAMYGDETVTIRWPEQEPAKAKIVAHRFGGNRRVTRNSYRALSGIGLLQTETTEHITVDFFHNVHAERCLDSRLASSIMKRQFTVVDTENYRGWKEITR